VDKNVAYPKAINELEVDKELPKKVKLRQKKYLNNIVELSASRDKMISQAGDGFRCI
jgi:transposase-like protein